MTAETECRALLEQALEKLLECWPKSDPCINAIRAELAKPAKPPYTYASTQATTCACCGKHKHTPLRIDAMDGYVCLTCIDQKLGSLLGEFGYPEPTPTPAWHDAPEVAALKAERDELLAALKAMYSEAIRIRCSIHQKWLQIMNTASAAIAKAEGRGA